MTDDLRDRIVNVMWAIEEFIADGWWDWHIDTGDEFMCNVFWSELGYCKKEDNIKDTREYWIRLVHPDDLQRLEDSIKKHCDSMGEIPFNEEIRFLSKSGEEVWMVFRGRVVEWDGKKPIQMVGVTLNITHIKNTERELENKVIELEERDALLAKKINELEQRDNTLKSLRELLEVSEEVKSKVNGGYKDNVD